MTYLWAVLIVAGLLAALAVLLTVAERCLVDYGVCAIEINAGERTLEVEGGQTLLSALYGEEIYIPSACGGKGTCGHCKVRVTAGGGDVLPTELPFLSRAERRAKVRLACQLKVRNDLALRIPEEILNVRLFTATVRSTRPLTQDIKEILLELDDPPQIEADFGQYVQVQAPSGEGPVWRAYSISSPLQDKTVVELNVRLVPGGAGSTYLHNLREGEAVVFTGPYGEFVLDRDPGVELICVGGGVGMAPIKNIIFSLYDRWPDRKCWLFFGCRTTKDIFYLEEFEALAAKHPNFRVVYALSDPLGPDERWEGETGFIHLAVDKYLQPGAKRQAFLCGPPPMIEAVTRVLLDKGLRESDIFYDRFD